MHTKFVDRRGPGCVLTPAEKPLQCVTVAPDPNNPIVTGISAVVGCDPATGEEFTRAYLASDDGTIQTTDFVNGVQEMSDARGFTSNKPSLAMIIDDDHEYATVRDLTNVAAGIVAEYEVRRLDNGDGTVGPEQWFLERDLFDNDDNLIAAADTDATALLQAAPWERGKLTVNFDHVDFAVTGSGTMPDRTANNGAQVVNRAAGFAQLKVAGSAIIYALNGKTPTANPLSGTPVNAGGIFELFEADFEGDVNFITIEDFRDTDEFYVAAPANTAQISAEVGNFDGGR